jgi:hypothetical protein
MALSTTTIGAIALVVALGVYLSGLLDVKIDPREPPVIRPKIPFIGHIIGMLTDGPHYMKRIAYGLAPTSMSVDKLT